MRVMVTGNAGFIGYHVAGRLIERGDSVVGFDVINDYYDPTLKRARLAQLESLGQTQGVDYTFIQAGVRYSLENPRAYVASNLVGFTNILEACRYNGVGHLTYASTSAVYGANTKLPFSEHDSANHPLQFYAATKRANELMAHSYAHLYGLPSTGLRFFTVYGPWGRPDMALYTFTRKILAGEPIDLYNHGNHSRDFTYIDDIVEGVIRTSATSATPNREWNPKAPDPATSNAPFAIYNIGNSAPVKLTEYIDAIEAALGKKAIKNPLPLQPGDVPDTFSDTSELTRATGYVPKTDVQEGVTRFVEWYLAYNAPKGQQRALV